MPFRVSAILIAALCQLSVAAWAESSTGQEVDLELVLAADGSGSVSTEMLRAQRMGFSSAFRDTDLQQALLSGPSGKVAVVYFEWAGQQDQRIIVPWTLLSNTEDVLAFAARLQDAPEVPLGGQTSISGAMYYAEFLLHSNGYTGLRKVVDIASNGINNEGRSVDDGLAVLHKIGVTVNALVLPAGGPEGTGHFARLFSFDDGQLNAYFRKNVIGGPGAFALEVDPDIGFADAILRKLAMEVAWADP